MQFLYSFKLKLKKILYFLISSHFFIFLYLKFLIRIIFSVALKNSMMVEDGSADPQVPYRIIIRIGRMVIDCTFLQKKGGKIL